MKKQLKANSIMFWGFGAALVAIIAVVLFGVTNFGLLPCWGLVGIPISAVFIFGIILLINKSSITLLDDRLVIADGNSDPFTLKVADIRRVYRDYEKNTMMVGGDMNVSTYYLLVFEMSTGQEIKVNEALYSAKNRAILKGYLNKKGIRLHEK